VPTYISKGGIWHPAKERVGLKNFSEKTIKNPSTDEKLKEEEIKPGEDYIYSGPDRAALFELWQVKAETLGTDFRQNPEFLQAVRNMGYSSYKKYLKDIGFDEKKMEEDFKKKAESISSHELPKRVKALDTLAGGKDFSGSGNDMKGGFDKPPDLK
jgi:hypothetical protein